MFTVYSSVKEIGRGGAHHETTEGKSEEIRAKEREDRKDPASDHDHEPRDCDDVNSSSYLAADTFTISPKMFNLNTSGQSVSTKRGENMIP